jgi:CRISPR/Cas system-associated endonuclease Cas3-HD
MENVREHIYLAALLHDIGKGVRKFQITIQNENMAYRNFRHVTQHGAIVDKTQEFSLTDIIQTKQKAIEREDRIKKLKFDIRKLEIKKIEYIWAKLIF